MSETTLFIENFSALHSTGIYSFKGFTPWENDQSGPRDIKRQQVLSTLYASFGKLNTPDKLAFSAAALALSDYDKSDGENTAITLAIPNGSYSTDAGFQESINNGFPSPALFSATLPSSPIADVAIFFGIKGPDRVFSGGDNSALAALDATISLLTLNKASQVLFLAVWENCSTCPTVQNQFSAAPANDCAIAFYCTISPRKQSARELKVKLTGNNDKLSHISGDDQEMFMQFIHSLINNNPLQITVSQSGFTGYISMIEKRK
jgi:hypothetical protein